ncbi:conserved hypothetical protein [Theileria orientalis strain Shintoku]|uniref:Uncharacterized protein n=1 Tax=Theileria orientalis strain Shintoku TaxID=869250 RepID=J4C8B0_THEOR|nr:conserved hypothetical protein [Theileria orientalis strain Shintoku]PVC51222.1 hypothetical protein MACL_00001673 [Theileria orientalis]BAM40473.1 conserved hypothetical protein [Theileria orientalis strain Shintoku]|eukprot:XP_009690774.1 conserved hypothetical protein [Theileria orientalis strain Shintoku]
MWHTRIRLRKSIRIEDEKLIQKPRGYAFRKAIQDKHGLAFFFIGMSTNLNLDTSLLTQKVFDVENFANITLFMYFGVLVSVVFLYLFLIDPRFYQLIVSLWLLVLSRVFHLILAIFASGKTGRNLFLVFYTVNGFLRGVISLTSNHVISQYFLNKSYLHLIDGGVMFSILVSLLQLACDEVIGSDTMKNARKSLIVAQILYLSITVIGCIWITVVYSIHSVEDPESPKIYGIEKTQVAINKFKYSRFYLSKLMVVILASVIRVSFHPVLIPFTMDIKHMYKLLGSIMFTVFEFVGRLMSFQVDEYIDPNKKSPNIDHDTFLVLLDVPKYLLFVMQLSACGVALYSTWKQRLGISKNPVIICLLALSSGFIVGFTSNCAFEGAQSSLEYYSHLKGRRNPRVRGEDSNPPGNIITADVAMDTSNANDILTLFNYVSYVAGSIISYVAYKIIKAHKESPWFIIKSRGDSLDVHAVNSLAQKLKLA